MSNKNICLMGIILGICGSVIIADWQSVWGDPCDQYGYERLKTMSANVTTSDSCRGGGDNETLPGVSRCVTVVLDIPFMHYCIIQYIIAIAFCSFVHKMSVCNRYVLHSMCTLVVQVQSVTCNVFHHKYIRTQVCVGLFRAMSLPATISPTAPLS